MLGRRHHGLAGSRSLAHTHSLPHQLTFPLAHSPAQSRTHPLTHSLANSPTRQLTHALTRHLTPPNTTHSPFKIRLAQDRFKASERGAINFLGVPYAQARRLEPPVPVALRNANTGIDCSMAGPACTFGFSLIFDHSMPNTRVCRAPS